MELILFGAGIIVLLLGFVTFKRKSENELSREVLKTPAVIVGALLLVASFIVGVLQ